MRAITWDSGTIQIIDQTLLPAEERILSITNTAALSDAIRGLAIRGAPALGIAGAMGVAQAAFRSQAANNAGVLRDLEKAARQLAATRPTAANLARGIERVLRVAREKARTVDRDKLLRLLEEEAVLVQEEDADACLRMAHNAQRFIEPKAVVLTHCNTGFLCTGGYGTALGAIRLAHEQGKQITVLATETRPLLQGARLTAWELGRLGVPHALITDGAAAGLLARGEVKVVIVGADRIAANGDVANKVGTLALALAAKDAGVAFIVAAPTSTVDLSMPSGDRIPIEERSAAEVTSIGDRRIAPPGTFAVNPAFDVTPARLVSAIVTETGVATPPFDAGLERLAALPAEAATRTIGRQPRAKAQVRPARHAKPAGRKAPSPTPARKKPARTPARPRPVAKGSKRR